MGAFAYSDSPYPIRADLCKEYRLAWQRIAEPGTWWSGAQRVDIAAETRVAVSCEYCRERKAALSPYALKGAHQHSAEARGELSDVVIDAIHRIVTDSSRLSKLFVEKAGEGGLSEEQYVEMVGVVVLVLSIDEFHRGLGLELEPLPEPVGGEPSRYRPAQEQLDTNTGYVAMLNGDGAVGQESDLWRPGEWANVLRALTLVPNAYREWRAVGDVQYLSGRQIMDYQGDTGRALDRMQIELVAGRVSSVNECFY